HLLGGILVRHQRDRALPLTRLAEARHRERQQLVLDGPDGAEYAVLRRELAENRDVGLATRVVEGAPNEELACSVVLREVRAHGLITPAELVVRPRRGGRAMRSLHDSRP